jgi:hypothetical protein
MFTSHPQSRDLPALRKGNTALFIVGKAVVSDVRASSYDSNKLTNKMQQFHKFIT